jgi:hypothetical protein
MARASNGNKINTPYMPSINNVHDLVNVDPSVKRIIQDLKEAVEKLYGEDANGNAVVFQDEFTQTINNMTDDADKMDPEDHDITSAEETAGYFTLETSPVNTENVIAKIGSILLRNQEVEGTQADFVIINGNEFHFNNNGSATNLIESLYNGDTIEIWEA